MGIFDSGSAHQTDIRHPTLRYFMKVLANTLLCKMEPSKVRVQELTLVYYAVRSLVHMEDIEETVDDVYPNIGASSPLAAGPSRQRRGTSSDDTTDED